MTFGSKPNAVSALMRQQTPLFKDANERSALAVALDAWQQRLLAAGLACRTVALHADSDEWSVPLVEGDAALDAVWIRTRERVGVESPVALAKIERSGGNDLLVVTSIPLPHGASGLVGVVLGQPHNERAVPMVLLGLGWLQLKLAAVSLEHNQRAAQLLEILAHVSSQNGARAAAQEWVNRTSAWAQAQPEVDCGFSLALFDVRKASPKWWVAANTAWAEKAAPIVAEATEVAARAAVEMQEIVQGAWWALPVLFNGEPTAVLVAHRTDETPAPIPDAVLVALRASASLAEPLLRQWREAERGFFTYLADAVRSAWRKLTGPGHLAWKLGGGGVVLALAILLLIPVSDRVTANTVIEGRTRHMVTAPFEGFIAQAMVRPGERVKKGQVLARLDDRDLLLEQGKVESERTQAASRLRQAMAERDLSEMALAQTELRQAEAQLALVQARLARVALVAPSDGLVVSGDWSQQIGSPIETGKEMFEVATTDGWRVVLHVRDEDIARVQPGQAGVLRLAGQPQTTYRFEVSRVTAVAEVEDGANGFRVDAKWVGETPPLTPGMQGVGKIEVGRTNLLMSWTRSSVDWLSLKLWSWW